MNMMMMISGPWINEQVLSGYEHGYKKEKENK